MLPVLPYKGSKPAELGAPLRAYAARHAPNVAAQLGLAAGELQKTRDKLAPIESLSVTTAEAVVEELLRYHAKLAQLERRFDARGAELGIKFIWRNAWRSKEKAAQDDLGWERVNVLFNAASAFSFCASMKYPKGSAEGGFVESSRNFQQAAGCLDLAHDLVKEAIWGLTPRWDPSTLIPDLRLEMLVALREMMLGHAQWCFYEKGIGDGTIKDSTAAKLASGVGSYFASALDKLENNQELTDLVQGEASLFSRQVNKTFIGRLKACRLLALSHAEWHEAREVAAKLEYGVQVARMSVAVEHASAAAAAGEAAGLPATERKLLSEWLAKVQAEAQKASQENRMIYNEQVPPPSRLAPIESRKGLVKPIRPELTPSEMATDFVGLLPTPVKRALIDHHARVGALLQQLTNQSSIAEDKSKTRLAVLELPQALDACVTDVQLPAHLVEALREAKAIEGGYETLQRLLRECKETERRAQELASMTRGLLDSEEVKDKEAKQRGLTDSQVNGMPSSLGLMTSRSTLLSHEKMLEQAIEVTSRLERRLNSAESDIISITPSIADLEAALPHLDGTPLSQEECVQNLRQLLNQLDRVSADMAASIAAAQATMQQQENDAKLGEMVLWRASGQNIEDAIVPLMVPFETIGTTLQEQEEARQCIFKQIEQESAIFAVARQDATSFAERQEYFRCLGNGARELKEIHAGLEEGKVFYKKIVERFQAGAEAAAALVDAREVERRRLLHSVESPPAELSSSVRSMPAVTAQASPAATCSSVYQGSSPYPGAQTTNFGGVPTVMAQASPYPGSIPTVIGQSPYPTAAPNQESSPFPRASAVNQHHIPTVIAQASPYPNASPHQGSSPYPQATSCQGASPYTPYPSQSRHPCAAAASYQQATPVIAQATPYSGINSYPASAYPSRPAAYALNSAQQTHAHSNQQHSIPTPFQAIAASAPTMIKCYSCQKNFGVPSGVSEILCAFCHTRNRVPGR